ncbi:MAG: hypothetical protein ABIP80_06325 [Ferruginibacter sp.]
MFKRYICILFLSSLALFTLSCGSSRRTLTIEEGWELLGELTVDFARDKDNLDINSSTRYTALRFKVENREVKIRDLKIVFANLDKLEPAIDEVVPADQYSKILELGPEGKEVRSVEFKYRTTGNILKGRGKVLIFGKRYVQPVY